MPIKGIIFDLDGVLLSTDQYHYTAWKSIADKLQIPFDKTINNRLRGVSRMESLAIVLEQYTGPALTQAAKEALAEEKNTLYRQSLQALRPCDVSDSVRQTLAQLRAEGYRMAIGSSSKNTPLIIEKTALANAFDAVSDGNNITRSKPDPEVFLKAAEFLGLAPEVCAVVEDARAGIDAANAGGMYSIGLSDAAAYAKADAHTEAFAQLPDILRAVR